MTTNPGRLALRLIITLLLSAVLFACGRDGNPAQENNSAAIAFQLKWPVAKSVASAPVGVVTVRMSVSGPGMTTMSKDFAASAGTGSIAGVPVGSNRAITFQGLDSNGVAIYQKDLPIVTLVQGPPYDCGLVAMDIVGVPVAPTALVATVISPTQINLVWVDNATYETGYKIERRTGLSDPYVQIGIAAANATSYSDTTLSQLTSYSYRVRAVTNGIGESGYSNEANDTTPEQTYSISGTITSGGATLAAVTVNLSGSAAPTTPATTDTAGFFSFSGVKNGSYTLTPVKAGYDFSPTTSTVLVNGANLSALNFTATANSVPNAPTELVATPRSSSWIELTWKDNANNETGYRIERAPAAGGLYQDIGKNIPANSSTYNDSFLSSAITYKYRVRAINGFGGVGYSAYSTEAQGTTYPASTAIAPVMVKVTGGTFTMGDTFGDGSSNELPLHKVTVGDFSIGAYEVTQSEWSTVMSSNPSFNRCESCPVEQVSWNDANAFIAKLNQLSGKNYRLPTEVEWEYAASVRTDGQKEKYSGGSDVAAVAWYGGNAGGTTHPVGGKLPNSRGLYDMSGNVWEWVSDWYGQYSNSDQTNPTGPASGTLKVGRGGGWNGGIADERSTRRDAGPPTVTMNSIGFRLAITNL